VIEYCHEVACDESKPGDLRNTFAEEYLRLWRAAQNALPLYDPHNNQPGEMPKAEDIYGG
jgi:hypothetical protein